MPDANRTTVDGVVPSILVEYVSNADRNDTNNKVTFANDDEGSPRSVTLGDQVYITKDEISLLAGGFNFRTVESAHVVPIVTQNPVVSSPITTANSPGQSG